MLEFTILCCGNHKIYPQRTNYLKVLLLKYDVICSFKEYYIPSNSERSEGEVCEKLHLISGKMALLTSKTIMHVKSLYIIVLEIISGK